MTTHFQNGITNIAKSDPLGDLKTVSPLLYHTFFEDFDYFNAGNWTITETGAGGTTALTDENGGVVLLTTDVLDNDNQFVQKVGESFLLNPAKKFFFQARIANSKATESDVVIGLQTTDTTPLDVTDGIYFLKADGSTAFGLVSRKDATTGSTTVASVATSVAATYLTLGFSYDGKGNLSYSTNGSVLGSVDITNFFPDTELTISFGVQNGEAGAQTMRVDYIYVAQER